jgi:hypothetical protein
LIDGARLVKLIPDNKFVAARAGALARLQNPINKRTAALGTGRM